MTASTVQKRQSDPSGGMSPDDVQAIPARLGNRPPDDLFPLSLTPFETLMLQDDLPGYPRVFSIVVDFEGRLDRDAFQRAAREVVARHPLLSAIVAKVGSQWQWIHVPFPDDQIHYAGTTRPPGDCSINLRKHPGFRIFGWTNGSETEIRLDFHHAVSDGQGARRVILDLTSLYASMISPDDPNLRVDPLDYGRLRTRGVHSREPAVATKPIPHAPDSLWQRCRTIYDFLAQQPTALRPAACDTFTRKAGPHHVASCRFDRSDVRRFRDKVRGTRFSLNDVAIALLLNTIARWNRQHGESGRDRLYRILVPVDLRETGDERLPAANRLSFVFLTRPTSLCLDWPRLLGTIRDEMDYIDAHGSKYNLIRALPIAQSVPGFVPAGVRVPVCFSTAVLTNLGNVLRKHRSRFSEQEGRPLAGNLRFLRANAAPPLRPKTHLGIGMTMSLDEITFRSQTNSKYFSSESAESFLQLFAESWRRWASSASHDQID